MGLQDVELGETPTSWRPALNIDTAGKLRGEWYLAGNPGADPITSSQTVTDNKWHHAVLTGAVNTQSLYLDGQLVGTMAGTISDQGRPHAYLGAGYASSGWMGVAAGTYHFTGQMDEVALYERTMSAATVDADGNRAATVSGTQARTTYTYDALGHMTKQVEPVTDAKSITTTFGYDVAGNRTRFTDGRGNTTTYTFTPWNLPESTIEPSTTAHPALTDRTWTTVYDKAGQDIAELLPGGVERHRTFDGLGRLVRETGTGAEATTTDRTLTYDLAGRITAAGTDNVLTRNTYTYNDRGQLLTADGPGGKVGYGYEADGNMTERVGADSESYYGYDDGGRIDWVWDSLSDSDIWYDFDTAGRPLLEEYAVKPAGSTEYEATARRDYTYDSLGRLASDRVANLDKTTQRAGTTYGYDLDDHLTEKTTSGTAGPAEERFWWTGEGDSFFFRGFADVLGFLTDAGSYNPKESLSS